MMLGKKYILQFDSTFSVKITAKISSLERKTAVWTHEKIKKVPQPHLPGPDVSPEADELPIIKPTIKKVTYNN